MELGTRDNNYELVLNLEQLTSNWEAKLEVGSGTGSGTGNWGQGLESRNCEPQLGTEPRDYCWEFATGNSELDTGSGTRSGTQNSWQGTGTLFYFCLWLCSLAQILMCDCMSVYALRTIAFGVSCQVSIFVLFFSSRVFSFYLFIVFFCCSVRPTLCFSSLFMIMRVFPRPVSPLLSPP